MQDISLKGYAKRIFIVTFGLVLAAYGVGLTVTAELGVSPWDVFSQGVALKLSQVTGRQIMMGTITQITAALVIFVDIALKEKIGVATIIDTCIFGGVLNIFLKHNVLPHPEAFAARVVFMLLGYIVWGLGIYIYMKPALGAGPKDALFVIFAKRKIPVSIAKNSIEAVVFVIGWLLGGTIGIGTVVAVFAMGYIIEFWFKLFSFDVTAVKNESIFETAKNIRNLLTKQA
ncbi:MAG: hypothetical protein IJO54_06450 [Oscillospiraceae bacterium]|nr:hypothetical protein [Oscillospiraceae bacterium]